MRDPPLALRRVVTSKEADAQAAPSWAYFEKGWLYKLCE